MLFRSRSHGRHASVVDMASEFLGSNGDDTVAKVRAVSSKVEDLMDVVSRPLRPYLPGLGRFLIVVTFLEDALRIMTQLNGEFLR